MKYSGFGWPNTFPHAWALTKQNILFENEQCKIWLNDITLRFICEILKRVLLTRTFALTMAGRDYSSYPPGLEEDLKALDLELEEGMLLFDNTTILNTDRNILSSVYNWLDQRFSFFVRYYCSIFFINLQAIRSLKCINS